MPEHQLRHRRRLRLPRRQSARLPRLLPAGLRWRLALELSKLKDLQTELNSLSAIAEEAKALHDAALAALDAAFW